MWFVTGCSRGEVLSRGRCAIWGLRRGRGDEVSRAIRVLRLREWSRVLLLLHGKGLLAPRIHFRTRAGLSLERCLPFPRSKLSLWAAGILISTTDRTCVYHEIGALALQLVSLQFELTFPLSKNSFFLLQAEVVLLLIMPPCGFTVWGGCHPRGRRYGHRHWIARVTVKHPTFRRKGGFRLSGLRDGVQRRKRDVARGYRRRGGSAAWGSWCSVYWLISRRDLSHSEREAQDILGRR